MKKVILNADDFGLTSGVNEGIIRAHRNGILTSTTVMANGEAFAGAAEQARLNASLGVGVHLVLIGGHAVARREEIASLVDQNGELPRSLGVFVARVTAGLIHPEHIERELRAQIEKVRAAGIEPTHVDSHKHTHAHPRVMESVARVASECRIKRIRKPFEALRDSWSLSQIGGVGAVTQLAGALAAQISVSSFESISRKYGLRSPDRFLGLAVTGQINRTRLHRMIETLSEGFTEIMLHPGICDDELRRTGSRLQMHRQTEMEALLDPSIKGMLVEQGVQLATYGELD
ncbi:MAG TPA: ChbG/HpnK family deacetylase [Candidatus Cybelea sp.]|nr:ChbG/HpnK family deacetylase [Candidatus Cybelea sp.]